MAGHHHAEREVDETGDSSTAVFLYPWRWWIVEMEGKT